jgi:L-serine deaminase
LRVAAALSTRWRVESATGPAPLNAREAVDADTPASAATAASVGRAVCALASGLMGW